VRSTVEPLEGNKVKVSVEVDEAEFDKAIDAAFRKIAREVRVPGFRPGKAPRRLLEARIGLAPAREQALQDAIPQYLAQVVREHDVDIIAPPEVDITNGREDGPVVFDATIEVRPQIIVPGYAGLRVELPAVEVTDAEVDEALEAAMRPYGELTDVERPTERGDYVTLDLSADRDGEPVPGLNTDDWSYLIGRSWIAPDFDDHLLGMATGDQRTFTITPTGTDDPAEVHVVVKAVQALVLPELTDEWVQENLGGAETVDEVRAQMREQMQVRKLVNARQLLVERTYASLAGLVDEDPPDVLVQNDLQHRADHFVRDLASRGIPFESYLAATGQDQTQLAMQLKESSTVAVKVDLALRAVAESEQLEVSDSDLDEEYARIAQRADDSPAKVRKAYERAEAVGDLKADLRKRKALEWLLRRVEVVDTEGRPIDRTLLLPDDEVAEAAAETASDTEEALAE
jgi:trigger factor